MLEEKQWIEEVDQPRLREGWTARPMTGPASTAR